MHRRYEQDPPWSDCEKAGPSDMVPVLPNTKEFLLEKSPKNVRIVGSPLSSVQTSVNIIKFTLEERPT